MHAFVSMQMLTTGKVNFSQRSCLMCRMFATFTRCPSVVIVWRTDSTEHDPSTPDLIISWAHQFFSVSLTIRITAMLPVMHLCGDHIVIFHYVSWNMSGFCVHQARLYNTNQTAVHKCIILSRYHSERSYQETICLHWWDVSSLSIDDVLILQLDVVVDLMANVHWKLFNNDSWVNPNFFEPLNPEVILTTKGHHAGLDNIWTKSILSPACSFALHSHIPHSHGNPFSSNIMLRVRSSNVKLLCFKSYKGRECEKLLTFLCFLIDHRVKRQWTVKIWRDIWP